MLLSDFNIQSKEEMLSIAFIIGIQAGKNETPRAPCLDDRLSKLFMAPYYTDHQWLSDVDYGFGVTFEDICMKFAAGYDDSLDAKLEEIGFWDE
jgi:hypothetical protein